MSKTFKDLAPGLTWATIIILLALGASFAHEQGHIHRDTMLRLVIGMNGIMIAWFGNRAPKAIAPSACGRRVSRFAGWSMVLSGLAYAGLWTFAPIPVATIAGTAIVAGGILLTLAYCLRLRARARVNAS